jgi:hypothetical protein
VPDIVEAGQAGPHLPGQMKNRGQR